MKNLGKFLAAKLHHQKLSKSSGAVAGLTSAVSVIVGMLAARMAPRGLAKLPVALRLAHKPFIVKAAPVIAGIAVACATAAGVIKFYSWCLERDESDDMNDPQTAKDED
jgi:hypothetical protein